MWKLIKVLLAIMGLAILALLLKGCANAPIDNVGAIEAALVPLTQLAAVYESLPVCAVPTLSPCGDAAIVARLRLEAAKAWSITLQAEQAARSGAGNAQTLASSAAAALVEYQAVIVELPK